MRNVVFSVIHWLYLQNFSSVDAIIGKKLILFVCYINILGSFSLQYDFISRSEYIPKISSPLLIKILKNNVSRKLSFIYCEYCEQMSFFEDRFFLGMTWLLFHLTCIFLFTLNGYTIVQQRTFTYLFWLYVYVLNWSNTQKNVIQRRNTFSETKRNGVRGELT